MSLACPVCQQALSAAGTSWRCPAHHSFDVARQGYLNLLLAQHRKSRQPGDDKAMVSARTRFLERGLYQPIREAVIAQTQALAPATVLDLGCGEGYYTSGLVAEGREVFGLDLSKEAILAACRRSREVCWLVAGSAHLPFTDQSLDLVVVMFCEPHAAEIARVLKPDSHLLLVTPGNAHLASLRALIYDEVRPYDEDKHVRRLAPVFELVAQHAVRAALTLTPEPLAELLAMTPHGWRVSPERQATLTDGQPFPTELDVRLWLFQPLRANDEKKWCPEHDSNVRPAP